MDWSPLQDDVYLKGTLFVRVTDRQGRPKERCQLVVRACGYV